MAEGSSPQEAGSQSVPVKDKIISTTLIEDSVWSEEKQNALPDTAVEDEPTVTLYRGDPRPTGPLSLSKTRTTTNLGHGLYFLDSEEAARFYMGQDSNVGQLTVIPVPQSVMARVIDVHDSLPRIVIDEVIDNLPPDRGARVREEFRGRLRSAPNFSYDGLFEALSRTENYMGHNKNIPSNEQEIIRRVLSSHGVTGVSAPHQAARQYSFWNEQAIQRLQRGESWNPPHTANTVQSTTKI